MGRWHIAVCSVLMAIIAVLAGCGSPPVLAPVGTDGDFRRDRPALHTVQRGETLYAIAWRYDADYRDIAAWNRIGPPYLIHPGQKLQVSPRGRSRQQRKRSIAAVPDTAQPAQSPRSGIGGSELKGARAQRRTGERVKSATASRTGAANRGDGFVKAWRWPARGNMLRTFSQTGYKGVDILGELGQPVLAAAAGKVVYSGGGLRGYGKLIIVKHNKHFLSAYAHNRNMLVKEGDSVTIGQRIGEMGKADSNHVMLHFEIRRDGKPVDPLRYLPR